MIIFLVVVVMNCLFFNIDQFNHGKEGLSRGKRGKSGNSGKSGKRGNSGKSGKW